MRLLPHPQPRRHQGRHGPEPRRRRSPAPARTASARAPSRASSTARSSQPARTRAGRPGHRQGAAADARRPRQGRGRARTSRPTWPTRPPRAARTRARWPQVGAAEAKGTAKAEGGKLEIPADPGGALAYVFADAEAPARRARDRLAQRVLRRPQHRASRAAASTRSGPVVKDGGVSTINVDVAGRRVPVLLHRHRPPRGRHGGHAHRQVSAAARRAGSRVGVLRRAQDRRSQRAGLIQASPFYLLVAFVALRARTLAREGRPGPDRPARADRRRRRRRRRGRPAAASAPRPRSGCRSTCSSTC